MARRCRPRRRRRARSTRLPRIAARSTPGPSSIFPFSTATPPISRARGRSTATPGGAAASSPPSTRPAACDAPAPGTRIAPSRMSASRRPIGACAPAAVSRVRTGPTQNALASATPTAAARTASPPRARRPLEGATTRSPMVASARGARLRWVGPSFPRVGAAHATSRSSTASGGRTMPSSYPRGPHT